jgi:hypothetical protein
MARSFQQRDFDLLGYQDPRVLHDSPGFAAYSVTAQAGIEQVPAYCLYVKAAITNDDARLASRFRCAPGQNFVVYHSGTEQRINALKPVLGKDRRYFALEQLLWERISTTFLSYVTSLREGIQPPNPYVTPRPEGQPKLSLDEALLSSLSDAAGEGSSFVQVIRAHAGVGKTSLARQLTCKLAEATDKYRLIPVYVESEHWARVGVKSFEHLWAMIDNSLRHFDENLHIPERLFNHLLQSGDLVLLFDGFDELCGHGLSQFSPRDVLQQLIRLRAESVARIILTTRTMYWESEVGVAPPEVKVWDLAPFTKQQAYDYIERRFGKKPKIKQRAHSLLGQVSGANQPPTRGGGKAQITYHPYIVEMVASSAEEGMQAVGAPVPGSLMLRLLLGKCEREQTRRKLVTTPDQQLVAFEDLAVNSVRTGQDKFTEEDCIIAGFSEQDRARLKDHPLIQAKRQGNQYEMRFRYDFLPQRLLGRYLVRVIKTCLGKSDRLPSIALELMEERAEGTGALFDHMCDDWGLESLEVIGRCAAKIGVERERAVSFLFHLAKAIDKWTHGSASKRERADHVLSLFGGEGYRSQRAVRRLYVHGTIDRFDLAGVTFESCWFVNVVFADCSVDAKTFFRQCRFLGEFDITGSEQNQWAIVKDPVECEMELAGR